MLKREKKHNTVRRLKSVLSFSVIINEWMILFTFYWATQLLKCIIFDLLIEMRVARRSVLVGLKKKQKTLIILKLNSLSFSMEFAAATACLLHRNFIYFPKEKEWNTKKINFINKMYIFSVKITLHFLPHIALTLNIQQHTLKLGNSRWMYIMHIKIYISLWMETHIYSYTYIKNCLPFPLSNTTENEAGRRIGGVIEDIRVKRIVFSPTCRIGW